MEEIGIQLPRVQQGQESFQIHLGLSQATSKLILKGH